MRGLQFYPVTVNEEMRIIPARAGFTGLVSMSRRFRADHPRACGVYSTSSTASDPEEGSSPRVRGLPWDMYGRTWLTGIIPARAGFTHAYSSDR